MANFEVKENPQFSETLRKLETTDKCHASIFNLLYEALLDNDNFLIKKADAAGTETSKQIQNLENPEFDDSGTEEGITSFTDFLTGWVSGTSLYKFMADLKAGLRFVLHAGQLVNNCVTNNPNLPLSAAQGKALMDLYTQLNSDLNSEFQLVATLTKASESISIDKSLVKHGFVIRYGGSAYIPKDLHPYNVPLLLVYDEGGYSYGKRINCDVTLQDNIYTVKMVNEGFASCFANNNYSRPTSGFEVQVYVA